MEKKYYSLTFSDITYKSICVVNILGFAKNALVIASRRLYNYMLLKSEIGKPQ